jgi:hypothetical protein
MVVAMALPAARARAAMLSLFFLLSLLLIHSPSSWIVSGRCWLRNPAGLNC